MKKYFDAICGVGIIARLLRSPRGSLAMTLILFMACNLQINLCYAQPISSTELINKAKVYDGKAVAYEGEVIGEVMPRGDYAWINVNDGKNAIGVWASQAMAREIIHTGTYKSRGDGIEVVGIFNRACVEHGGDLDIHAQVLRKIAVGRLVKERYNQDKVNLVITLGVICAILSLIWIFMKLKRK